MNTTWITQTDYIGAASASPRTDKWAYINWKSCSTFSGFTSIHHRTNRRLNFRFQFKESLFEILIVRFVVIPSFSQVISTVQVKKDCIDPIQFLWSMAQIRMTLFRIGPASPAKSALQAPMLDLPIKNEAGDINRSYFFLLVELIAGLLGDEKASPP